MGACKCCRSLGVAAALALASAVRPANATSESQTLLTCSLAEGEPLTSESLASPRSGRDSRLALSWYRREPGLLPQVETSARLRLEVELEGLKSGAALVWRDGSSWLGAEVGLAGGGRLGLKAFPFDTDYERLGYLHALDWGGTDAAHGESIFVQPLGGVPGLELGFSTGRVELRAGLRWASAPPPAPVERLWAGLLRGSLRVASALRADFGLGYFERPSPSVSAVTSFVEGASVRLVWHAGQSEPELAPEPFRPPALRQADEAFVVGDAPGRALALEAVALATRLRRFEAPAQTHLALAPALALYGSSRAGRLAGHAALSWRSLAFVQRNQPGLMHGETAPAGTVEHAELAAWLGASLIAGFGFTPSLQVGALLPAALETPSALPGFAQSFVLRAAGTVVALPVGSARLPLLASRAALRLAISPSLSILGFADYERDPNRVRLVRLGLGARRAFAAPDRFAGGAALRAAF